MNVRINIAKIFNKLASFTHFRNARFYCYKLPAINIVALKLVSIELIYKSLYSLPSQTCPNENFKNLIEQQWNQPK